MKLYHISQRVKEGLWKPLERYGNGSLNREPCMPCICASPTIEECFKAVWMIGLRITR